MNAACDSLVPEKSADHQKVGCVFRKGTGA
jgi:hypothetical protein